jgi:hypothetical protein
MSSSFEAHVKNPVDGVTLANYEVLVNTKMISNGRESGGELNRAPYGGVGAPEQVFTSCTCV